MVLKKDTAMRCIFIYDTAARRILESQDVTRKTPFDRELIRIGMLLRCDYPSEVFDSEENGVPYGVNRRWLMAATQSVH